MCGRFTVKRPASAIADELNPDQWPDRDAYSPCFNVAPTMTAPVAFVDGGPRFIRNLRWGLVPRWAADPAIGNRLINARSETLTAKPAFRGLVATRRCIVAADGFYEWRRTGGARVPHHIRRADGGLLLLAGLWDTWQSGERFLGTFTIITVPARGTLAELHPRMPGLVNAGAVAAWLDVATVAPASALALLAEPAAALEYYPVSSAVNSPRNNAPELIEPLAPPQPV